MLWDVKYYDDLGRDTLSYAQHYLGGHGDYSTNNYDKISTHYNFTDQVDTTIRRHYTKANTTTSKMAAAVQYTYDQVGRKLYTGEQLYSNGVSETSVYLSNTAYNQVGQVTQKNYHIQSGMTGYLNTINYSYNERGWITAS